MNRKKKSTLIAVLYVLGDVLSVIGGFLTAYYLRFYSQLFIVEDIPPLKAYAAAIAVSTPIFLILFRYYHLYQTRSMTRRWDVIKGSFYAVTFGMILCMAITFIFRQGDFAYSRLFILLGWLIILFYFNFLRYLTNKIERVLIKRKGQETRVVILGVNKMARSLIKWIKDARYSGYRIAGIYTISDQEKGAHIQNCEILGDVRDFESQLKDLDIDEVILSDPKFSREETAKIMLLCDSQMISFKVVADLYGMVTSSVDVEHLNTVPILGLKQLPLDDLWNRILKRIFDITGSGIGLILTAPLFILVPILIKMSDRGPVYYKQERVGKDGKMFNVVKFRTMVPDAEQETGPVWASNDDERKTAVGEFLRKTNIDELPQLWNVFIGQMSLVGPRPERPFFVERFRKEIPRYMFRHKIKSGITGWAQVYGYRGDAEVHYKGKEKTRMGIQERDTAQYDDEKQHIAERIQLDIYYIENWSLLLDIEILFRTVFAFKNAF